MDSFVCYQITPNSLYYRATKTSKTETKKIEGYVRTRRERYFDMEALEKFAEDAAYAALNPQAGEKRSDGWKGKHGGVIRGKPDCNRKNRKTHSERRAQIVSRSMAAK